MFLNAAANMFVVGSPTNFDVGDDRCWSATRTRFEARQAGAPVCLRAQQCSSIQSCDSLSSFRESIDTWIDCSRRCAYQCSSLTVSTASACGDCNVPVTRTFLPRNFFTREILVNMYAWGLDSSVRKNIWLQSTIVPTTSRCPSPSEPLEHPSAQSAIRGGAVAS